jgi:hypothetical protein
MTALKLLTGVVAMSSLLAVFATQRDPPRPPEPVVNPIAERWVEPPPMPKKTDRLALYVPPPDPAPTPVAAIPVATIEPATEDDLKQARAEMRHHRAHHHHHHERGDVCTRHHMHKVVTHGGKSWRCR